MTSPGTEPDGTDGPQASTAARYEPASQRVLDGIYAYRGRAPFDDLLRDYEGPFRGLYQVVDRFERDGKCWARIEHYASRHLIDIELDEGDMIQVIAVPAAEA